MATLAGDALLTDAFLMLAKSAGSPVGMPPAVLLATVAELAEAAGSAGMVAGQAIDLLGSATTLPPAALDLFTWLSYRCFVAKGRERVPLFGESGLVSQLGSADYSRPRKFRERLEGWLNLVRSMWPECPASIDSNGTGLYVDRANAVLPNGGNHGTQ